VSRPGNIRLCKNHPTTAARWSVRTVKVERRAIVTAKTVGLCEECLEDTKREHGADSASLNQIAEPIQRFL